ncbi:phasin family protein [Noviherbaspirillum sp. 1P10PC]|uniref:phasin family protein n=1 Tax=Noviherbaspirillum sp. 1P10PC TaxID=3132292 RepID=UPI0039A11113
MARKRKEIAATKQDASLMDAVCQSAHQIWQAGLGAFAAAQEQGDTLFSKLAADGARLQKQIEHAAGERLPGIAARGAGDSAHAQEGGSWEKLEKVFEDRVGRALHSLGVPTQKDFKALGRQIEELNRTIAQLAASSAPAPRQAAKRTVKQSPAATRAKAAAKQAAAPTRRPSREKAQPVADQA